MNDKELEAFLAVVEQGSFTSAAKKLFITQSALSSRIEALEMALGRQLFLRQKGMRNAVLTESGRRLIPIAQEWRGLAARAKQSMGGRFQKAALYLRGRKPPRLSVSPPSAIPCKRHAGLGRPAVQHELSGNL